MPPFVLHNSKRVFARVYLLYLPLVGTCNLLLGMQKVPTICNKLLNSHLIFMKRKPLNKSRLNYLKQNTPLNVVPEKRLKRADLAGLVENRGKSRSRTKRLRERVETLIGVDLVFKNKTNAKPHAEQLVRTTIPKEFLVGTQARNTLKAKEPFHLNIHAKRTLHLLAHKTGVGQQFKQTGSRCAGNANPLLALRKPLHQSHMSLTRCQATHPLRSNTRYVTLPAFSKAQSNCFKLGVRTCLSTKAHEQKKTYEKDEIGTKYIVKRTFLGSTRTLSNTRFKVHSQDLKQLIEGRGRKVSPYKARLLERKKLSLIYGNLGWRELRKCVLQSKHKKGVASPKSGNKKTRPQTSSLPDNLITLLESRLDVVLYRCRFLPSFASCKQAISHGKISVNHRQVRIAGHLLKAGDLIQVNPQSKQSLLVQTDSTACFQRVGTHKQEHVVEALRKANCLLGIENEKQKTLLYFQNKIRFKTFSPVLPSALLTRFDPLHVSPWNTNPKPSQLNNTSLFSHNKQDYGSRFLKKDLNLLVRTNVGTTPLSASVKSFDRTKTPLSLNLENQANSLFRDLKERKRILRTLSSTFNERLHGDGERFKGRNTNSVLNRTTDRLIKPLRNRDNPSLFLRSQSKSGVKSQTFKEHNTPEKACLARAAAGLRDSMGTASSEKHVLRANSLVRTTGLRKLFPPLYRAVKPLNLEVSYQTLTAIFLFPPQKVYFPAHIDLEMIGKSI